MTPILRMSNALHRLRQQGSNASVAKILEDYEKVGNTCTVHGHLSDPIITILGNRVAFGCPWCSDSAILRAWENEPLESVKQ